MIDFQSKCPACITAELIKFDVSNILPEKQYLEDSEVYDIAIKNFVENLHGTYDDTWVRLTIDEIFHQCVSKSDPYLLATKHEAFIVLSKFRDRITELLIRKVTENLNREEISKIISAVDSRYLDLVSLRVPLMYLQKYGLPVVNAYEFIEKRSELALLEDIIRSMIPGINSLIHSSESWGRGVSINNQIITFPRIFSLLESGKMYNIDDCDDSSPFICGSVIYVSSDGWRNVHLNIFNEIDIPDINKKTQIFMIDSEMMIIHNAGIELCLDETFNTEFYQANDLPEYENHWEDIDLFRIGRFTCNMVVTRQGKISLLGAPNKTFSFTSDAKATINLRNVIIETVQKKKSRINGWL